MRSGADSEVMMLVERNLLGGLELEKQIVVE